MPQIIRNFLNSEKAVASAIPLIGATVFVFTGEIDVQEWMSFCKWVLGIYVAGKTVQGTAKAVADAKRSAPNTNDTGPKTKGPRIA